MDRIENFLRKYNIIALVQEIFATLETTISLEFILNKIPKWYYIIPIYSIPLIIAYSIGFMPSLLQTSILIFICFIIPIIDDLIHKKFSWKSFWIHLLKLLIVSIVSFILQVIIYGIKSGDVSIVNHTLSLSGYFIYSLEYDIALFVILFTISLYINREKGDSNLWMSQVHGSFSQTSQKQLQKSNLKKNLTKTQRNKLRLLYVKIYLSQTFGFLLLMVLPFILGKVFGFLIMYLAFTIARYILGFNYSLHYKKESICITVGIIVFGILTLAVPFFTVDVILALVLGVSLAILLHLSYKYKGMWLFDKVERQAQRIQQLELQQALCGVVRYPTSYTYSAGPSQILLL